METKYLYTVKGEIRKPDAIVEVRPGVLLLVKEIVKDSFSMEADCLCQIVYVATGEIREQRVDNCNLHLKWRDTVLKRAKKFDESDLTPQVLMPIARRRS